MGELCSDAPDQGVCGVHDPDRLQTASALRQTLVSKCDMGRKTVLSVTKGVDGMRRVAAAGDGTFFLFAGWSLGGVVRVDAQGAVLQELPVPSELSPWLDDLLVLPSGNVLLSGSVGSFAGDRAWVGEVDVGWQLVWEQQLGPAGVRQVDLGALPDGGVIVAAVRESPEVLAADASDGPRPDLYLARLESDGELSWQHALELSGYQGLGWNYRFMTTEGGRVRVVLPTADALVLVTATADGELEQRPLQTTLALGFAGVAALAEGALAIASNRDAGAILSLVDVDGNVTGETSYGREDFAAAAGVSYDPTRDEIVIAGYNRGPKGGTVRTWMIATDRNGQQHWQLTRKPMELGGIDGNVISISADRGPDLQNVVVADDGTLLATGSTAFDLSFMIVGGPGCE
jgi:hypothetical protein